MPHAPTPDQIRQTTLESETMSVTILNLGCITQDWRVRHAGADLPIVLGYRAATDYLNNPAYLGAIVGRVANRIGGAAFELNGARHTVTANAPPHCLHGGDMGISKRIWEMDADETRAVELRHTSPHGDQGFPGEAVFTTTITLSGTTLTYDMRATVDRPTPINLAQHNYYNLMGRGTAHTHTLHIPANQITERSDDGIPNGTYHATAGNRFDFTRPRAISDADPAREGYDDNLVLSAPHTTLSAPNGLSLSLTTDQPGLQLYSSMFLTEEHTPHAGQSHTPYSAICLEPQHFPDALNKPGFAPIIATPGAPYHQRLTLELSGASR
ncbi:aldose epimerase family protein [Shimia abyssi]|uniref:Aldose 1-epimerase n=1 Tax=Shimia abyssi TaxID=1662395 RepID=A0A2P8FGV2_9RHOB|nr:aldose epimerase family protein [Shimia abyssi]PSL20929.1 aldose 1-epimerase [Shimia abyssi]